MDWIIVFFGLIIVGLCVHITVIRNNTPEYIKILERDLKETRKNLDAMFQVNDTYIFMLDMNRKERERLKKEVEKLEQELVDIRKEKVQTENS